MKTDIVGQEGFQQYKRAIAPLSFDKKKNAWLPSNHAIQKQNIQKKSLTFITYNIWFSNYMREERYTELLKLINETDADFVCLQEVIPPFLKLMVEDEGIREKYFISDATGNTIGQYGVILLSKLPLKELNLHSLPTRMGRSVLIADVIINDEKCKIATVHLESLSTRKTRKIQLELISNHLKDADVALLMGDFNFDCSRNFSKYDTSPLENENLKLYFNEYIDIWPHLHPDTKGYTYDSEINKMLDRYEQMRYDRIILCSRKQTWKPKSIDLLGNKSFIIDPNNNREVFISDHFGLHTCIEFIK